MIKDLKITRYVRKIIGHPLFAGSMVMVIGSNIYNFGQFIFHFLAGRLLGTVYYGDVAALVSTFGLVAFIQLAFGLTIVRFVAVEKDKKAVSNLSKWVNWWSLWAAGGTMLVTLAASPLLAKFLNITDPFAVYLLGPAFFFFIMVSTWRYILQGIIAFNKYVASLLIEGVAKVVLAAVFLLAGFAVSGAIGAIVLAMLLSLFVTRVFLAPYLRGKRGKKPNILPILKYSFPVLIQGLALTSMYSTDLILVKHFFPPSEAGIYASLAILGRIVFFGGSPITSIMFPLVAKRYSHGKAYHNVFYLSTLLVVGGAAALTVVYFLFPRIPIGILFGSQYISGAPYLWWFGVFMGLLAVATHLVQFYLSVGKTRIVYLFVLAAFLQIVLIWFIHPSLLTVVQLSILSAALLLVGLLVYFPYHRNK